MGVSTWGSTALEVFGDKGSRVKRLEASSCKALYTVRFSGIVPGQEEAALSFTVNGSCGRLR